MRDGAAQMKKDVWEMGHERVEIQESKTIESVVAEMKLLVAVS
jgi:hypothetical protein